MQKKHRTGLWILIALTAVLILLVSVYRMPRRITFSGAVQPEQHLGSGQERGEAEILYELEIRHYLFRPDTVRGTVTVDGREFVNAHDQPTDSIQPISMEAFSVKLDDEGIRNFRLASLDGTPDAVGSRYQQYDNLEIILIRDGILIRLCERTPEYRRTTYRTYYR